MTLILLAVVGDSSIFLSRPSPVSVRFTLLYIEKKVFSAEQAISWSRFCEMQCMWYKYTLVLFARLLRAISMDWEVKDATESINIDSQQSVRDGQRLDGIQLYGYAASVVWVWFLRFVDLFITHVWLFKLNLFQFSCDFCPVNGCFCTDYHQQFGSDALGPSHWTTQRKQTWLFSK